MDDSKPFSIVVTGLGGQGILLLAKTIANAALSKFPYVCRTETRGLSQRGGSVQSMVRFAYRRVTAVVEEGSADLVISLELLESARSIPLLAEEGVLVGNENFLPPANLVDRWKTSPDKGAESEFRQHLMNLIVNQAGIYSIDALTIATTAQCAKAANVAVLGAASHFLPIPHEQVRAALLLNLKSEFRAANTLAFDAGRDALRSLIGRKQRIPA